MSDPENFIARWSRRKRKAAEATGAAKPPVPSDAAAEGARNAQAEGEESGAPELPFDVTSLPPIESIGADSDIRAFLAPGVPPDLTRAALRRVWSADPKIRDFVGLADYAWDFNTPGAMLGFGPLEMTDELRRQVAQMVGRSLGGDETDRPTPALAAGHGEQVTIETLTEPVATTAATQIQQAQSNRGTSQDEPIKNDNELYNSDASFRREQENIAPQYGTERPDDVQLIAKRSHGRALPK